MRGGGVESFGAERLLLAVVLGVLSAVGAGASVVQAFAQDAGQATAATAPDEMAGFQPVGRFQVRFDRLERPRGSAVVRAVVTVRFVFNPDMPQLDTLALIDAGDRVEFRLSGR